MCGSRGGDVRGSGPPGKSQVAIIVFRNTGMDPPPLEKRLDPLRTIGSRGRSIRSSVNYVEDKKNIVRTWSLRTEKY